MELLLGAGSNRSRQIPWEGRTEWSDLLTVDFNDDHKPDVIHDLEKLPLPFDSDTFEEIHAYHVLEHTGWQGDWRFFFAQFSDFWRMLKPNGVLCVLGPAWNSRWAFGDPGHTRVLSRESLIYLSQPEYSQVGKTPMTDYRFVYREDFDTVYANTNGDHFGFVLKCVKPTRCALG